MTLFWSGESMSVFILAARCALSSHHIFMSHFLPPSHEAPFASSASPADTSLCCDLRTAWTNVTDSQQTTSHSLVESSNGVRTSFGDAVKYEALSYVLGDASLRLPITVNGKELFITTNLHVCLKRLRHTSEPQTLWIDAICSYLN
jgi:hypothetical protein